MKNELKNCLKVIKDIAGLSSKEKKDFLETKNNDGFDYQSAMENFISFFNKRTEESEALNDSLCKWRKAAWDFYDEKITESDYKNECAKIYLDDISALEYSDILKEIDDIFYEYCDDETYSTYLTRA